MFWHTKKRHHSDQHDKDKQIKELKSVFPSIRRPNNDDSLFSVQFCVDNKYSALRIFIPADFPNIRPVLQVDGPVMHPWLDPFKQVNGCEKLIHWSKQTSLVEVVEETIATLSAGTNAMVGQATEQSIPNLHAQLSGVSPIPPRRHSSLSGASLNLQQQSQQQQSQPQSMGYGAYPAVVAGASQYAAQSQAQNYSPNLQYQQQQPYQQQPYQQQPYQQQQYQQQQPYQYQAAVPSPSYNSQPSGGVGGGLGTGASSHLSQGCPSGVAANLSVKHPAGSAGNETHNNGKMGTLSRQTSSDNPCSPMINLPDLPNSFPELEKLTVVQLERLLSDDVALEAHVVGLESVKSMELLLEQLSLSNLEAASKNLELGEELNILERGAKRQKEDLVAACKQYEEDVQAATVQYHVPAEKTLQDLKKQRDAMDDTSEEVGRNFVDGQKELPAFIEDFLAQRTAYHTLCAKITALENN